MSDVTTVTLRNGHRPVFPQRCVGCGYQPPDAVYKIKDSAYGLMKWLIWWWPSTHTVRVEVPACRACEHKMRWSKWRREAMVYGAVFAAVAATVFLLPPAWKPYRKFIALGAGVLAIVPYAIHEVVRPRIVSINTNRETTDFEFVDADYAWDFRALNIEGWRV